MARVETRADATPDDAPPAPPRGFRGDIQGLRAIAVLTVIAGHAGLSFLPGGFVGVDVFFVISGFLISDLLYREVDRDGRVSLGDFYARRARRILPAATLVTVVTVLASLLLVNVVDALDVVTDALWATFFAANVRFAAVGTDYFAQEQLPSPLQHYWSLAVEEQFYVVWPLLLLALLWLVRRRAAPGTRSADPRRLPRLPVFWLLVVVGVASFGYGVVHTHAHPEAAYFSTPARAWELAVGALAALVARAVATRLPAAGRGILAGGGLLTIVVACVGYDESVRFPGVAALLPVLGAAAVLVAGAGRHEREPLPLRALAVKPLRVVGDWSFSLYLWHWPLLVIPRLRSGESLSPGATLLAVAATFGLAALTYRFVETPFRSARRWPRPRALALYPVSVALVALVCLGGHLYGVSRTTGDGPAITVANSGLRDTKLRVSDDPTVALVQASVVAARRHHAIPKDLHPTLADLRDDRPDVTGCNYTEAGLRTLCARGDTDADRTVVVLGDSHGLMWVPAVERIAQHSGWRAYYLVKPNCTAADVVVADSGGTDPWADCSDFRQWAFDQIADLHPDLVIVSSTGSHAIATDDGPVRPGRAGRSAALREGFTATLERLVPLADRVVLLRDVPRAEDEPGPCLTEGGADLGSCDFTPVGLRVQETDAAQDAAVATDVEVIDPTRWLCWRDECPAVIGDYLPYRDRDHLTTDYAAELGDDLGRALGIWD